MSGVPEVLHHAAKLQTGLNEKGLPTGIQVVANQDNDHLSLACAVALEQATGGWIPPWQSWLADLPNSALTVDNAQLLKNSVQKRGRKPKN